MTRYGYNLILFPYFSIITLDCEIKKDVYLRRHFQRLAIKFIIWILPKTNITHLQPFK